MRTNGSASNGRAAPIWQTGYNERMGNLPYGIKPAPPDLRSYRLRHIILRVAMILTTATFAVIVLRAWLGDGPPPSERPSDTFYGLSEGE